MDLTAVERVHTVDAVTWVPGLRPPWAGLVSLQGEILPALDLHSYLTRRLADEDSPRPPVGGAVVGHSGLRVLFLSEAPVALSPRAAGGVLLDVPTILGSTTTSTSWCRTSAPSPRRCAAGPTRSVRRRATYWPP